VSSTCSQTEVQLFAKDTTGACLNCALAKSCIDDTIGTGDTSQECDDFASATTAPVGATPIGATGVSECVATLSCYLGVNPFLVPCPLNIGTSRSLSNPYCGTASAMACQMGSPVGVCLPEIVAGFPPSFNPGIPILSNIANPAYPSGMAGAIVTCLLKTAGGQCSSCVN
jgi:hypothetical protein